MAITIIGSISLDWEMRWIDQWTFQPVSGSSERTISGGIVAQAKTLPISGTPVTLQGDDGEGWQTQTTVTSLRALAAQLGVTFPVRLRGTAYTCRWRHEIDGGPVQMRYLQPSAPLDTQTIPTSAHMIGTLYLEMV